jgi:sugar phosphate isomerase/epimerase
MPAEPNRREWMTLASAALGVGSTAPLALAADPRPGTDPFVYCLNTSTVQGQKLDLVEIIAIASKAGFQAIEPWVGELERHTANGGLKELGKRFQDNGLQVADVIAFPEWAVDDETRRKKGFEDAKRVMDMVTQIGGKRLAAPPAGATKEADLSLGRIAERYRTLLELGAKMGVVPQLELWGFSKVLSRLGEVAYVAIEAGHPDAAILLDVYHIYKGGNGVDGLRLLNGAAIHILHFNDYPGEPARTEITDAARVYPGDGVAPIRAILRTLRDQGFRGVLSLELFNRDYWKQDAAKVIQTGLEKMKAAVQTALA